MIAANTNILSRVVLTFRAPNLCAKFCQNRIKIVTYSCDDRDRQVTDADDIFHNVECIILSFGWIFVVDNLRVSARRWCYTTMCFSTVNIITQKAARQATE